MASAKIGSSGFTYLLYITKKGKSLREKEEDAASEIYPTV